jgi:hypothetical protein
MQHGGLATKVELKDCCWFAVQRGLQGLRLQVEVAQPNILGCKLPGKLAPSRAVHNAAWQFAIAAFTGICRVSTTCMLCKAEQQSAIPTVNGVCQVALLQAVHKREQQSICCTHWVIQLGSNGWDACNNIRGTLQGVHAIITAA